MVRQTIQSWPGKKKPKPKPKQKKPQNVTDHEPKQESLLSRAKKTA